jgi:dipeptidase
MARVIPKIMLAFGLVGFTTTAAFASYAVFVGSNLTEDGSTMLGGTGDEPSSHWLEIVPHRSWPAESKINVGVDDRANFPGELIEIPQVKETARYITMNYSEWKGFPAPLTMAG